VSEANEGSEELRSSGAESADMSLSDRDRAGAFETIVVVTSEALVATDWVGAFENSFTTCVSTETVPATTAIPEPLRTAAKSTTATIVEPMRTATATATAMAPATTTATATATATAPATTTATATATATAPATATATAPQLHPLIASCPKPTFKYHDRQETNVTVTVREHLTVARAMRMRMGSNA
jgi:hypothetical protein